MGEAIQVFTTAGTRSDAEHIAYTVVERRVAACAQVIGPITSIYWWEGTIETAEEWLCLIKSTQQSYPALERAIGEVHPYQVPEILAVPVVAGSRGYQAWLEDEIGGSE